MAAEPPPDRPLADRHLWQIRPFRDVMWVLLVVLVLGAAYLMRAILAPIAVAFALAYAVDPVVRALRDRLRIPRAVSAVSFLIVSILGLALFLVWLLPTVVDQADRLASRLPEYVNALGGEQGLAWLFGESSASGSTTRPATQPTAAQRLWRQVDQQALIDNTITGVGRLFGFVGDVVGTTTYLGVAFILIVVLFVFFTARFDALAAIRSYLPASRRDYIWELLGKINGAFAGYVRGQLIVAVFTFTGFCIGFSIAGVPYWFLVSLVGGVLSLIPYGQMSGWLLAIAMKYLEVQAGDAAFTWFSVLIAPSLVYAVTQSMETWVVTPWVQSESVNLHPVTIILVLLIGGTLAGIVGLILAIPVTASVQILFNELARPRVERWVATH